MSGIFGIISFDGRAIDLTDLRRMSEKMAHRGPDGSDVLLDKNVGFGQLMLCSTKESLNEQLPYQDSASGLLITADARIDNRDELLSALSIKSSLDSPITDSQIILAAYQKWDKACVDHLLGDFSFAIWDKRTQSLFVARDHMGLRPFYYYSSEHLFVFASAANAIAEVSVVSTRINQGRVADFLIQELEGINNTDTFFENIYRMSPAHFGVVEKKKVSFQRYWKLDPEATLQLGSDDEYADALEEALTFAITARLRSHRPTSSMLSGGVDSSTIAGLARKINQESGGGLFRTYSGVSDDMSGCVESGYINQVIDQGGLDPVLFSPSEVKKYSSEIEKISGIVEDPFDENWIILRLIFLAAREHGNNVVMDGMGGDLVAGISPSFPSYLLRQGEIGKAFREINAVRINFWERDMGWLKAYTQAVRPVIVPHFLRRLRAHFRTSNLQEVDYGDSMLSEDFANKVKLPDRWKEYRGQRTSGFCPSIRHAHAETIVVPFQTVAIERYTRLASYCGIESRQPFFDKRVVELCLSLPWQQKAQNGYLKYCLRNVLQRVAPAEVAWRSEFDSIMWKFNAAWDEKNRTRNIIAISEGKEQLLGMLNERKLEQTLSKYTNGDEAVREPILNLVTLLNWLQRNQPAA